MGLANKEHEAEYQRNWKAARKASLSPDQLKEWLEGRAEYARRWRKKRTEDGRPVRYKAKTAPKKRNPEAIRARNLRRDYGLTVEQYEEMAKNGCNICGTMKCASGRRLAVDHCHSTGKIRGILCSPCNTAIGKLKDDPEMLRKAISYLESTR